MKSDEVGGTKLVLTLIFSQLISDNFLHFDDAAMQVLQVYVQQKTNVRALIDDQTDIFGC